MKKNPFRHSHNLGHSHLLTMDGGFIVPLSCIEALPGDTMRLTPSAVIRATPMAKPMMHRLSARLHMFFVPNRLLWDGWEDFIVGNDTDTPPMMTPSAHTDGSLLDYLGVYADTDVPISKLPHRGYNLIWNEYYRDKDLQDEVDIDNTSLLHCCWPKDKYTTARPFAQRGDAVTVPLVGQADVTLKDSTTDIAKLKIANGHGTPSGTSTLQTSTGYLREATGSQYLAIDPNGTLEVDASGFSSIQVRDLRRSFAIQRFQEQRARMGSTYADLLRSMGIRPSDARLQLPEYLGGNAGGVSISEVLNTTGTGTTLGDMGGHGIGTVRTPRVRRFFEEHGLVYVMLSIRPQNLYCQGVPKMWTRTTREDYFDPILEDIGHEEIRNRELYANHSSPDGVFGYGPRYSDYRSIASRISGEFQSSVGYDWHMGRIFDSDVALNSTFLECTPTKRVFLDQTHDSFYVYANIGIHARRMVSRKDLGSVL